MKDATKGYDSAWEYYLFGALVLASMCLVPIITVAMLAWDWARGKLGTRA